MAGWATGRSGGRPVAEHCVGIDLPWLFKTERAIKGKHVCGTLHWSRGGELSGSISYHAIMDKPGDERLELAYTRGEGENAERVRQTIHLAFTKPHYGGKRWWMICLYRGVRLRGWVHILGHNLNAY
jgi:hypothetical protein